MPCNTNINGSPASGMNVSVLMSPPSSLSMNMNQAIRVHSPATATPAIRAPKEVAFRPKGIVFDFLAKWLLSFYFFINLIFWIGFR